MKKLFLEIFIFLAVFFSAYFFIFQEGSTTGGRAVFLALFGLIFLFYFSYTDAKKALNSWFASDTETEQVKEKLRSHSNLINDIIDSMTRTSNKLEETEKHIFEISGPSKKRAEQINAKLDTLSLGHEEIRERFREFEKRLNIQTETSENFMQLLENYSDRIRNLESEINLIQEQIKPIEKKELVACFFDYNGKPEKSICEKCTYSDRNEYRKMVCVNCFNFQFSPKDKKK